MSTSKPILRSDAAAIADDIIARTDGDIRLALPLGLGKANTIVNALTERALGDPQISLSIHTALTLERPDPGDPVGSRFIGQARDRLFGVYPGLRYAELLRAGDLPGNITVQEFFLLAGRWLGHGQAQQNYISANYTHALGFLLARRPNAVTQLLARDADGRLSLSCNTDITLDLLDLRRAGKADFVFAGEVNSQLPFMPGSAVIDAQEVEWLLDDRSRDFELFSMPRLPVSATDHAIGHHVSRLIPDGGTLQIGIGAIGDAIANALRRRNAEPETHNGLADRCPFARLEAEDHRGAFETGLYSVTEMLVEGLLELFEEGIIRDVRDGAAIHAGFFVGSRDFYRRLREMAPEKRALIDMRAVSFTNALYGGEEEKRAARPHARFVNSAMKVTALGAAVSDALEDGQIVGGVGGQFDFINQAFALEGARSVLTLTATRRRKGKVSSNIVWSYPTETVPRHMRDIVVTEYGVADLRGRSDAQTIQAMIRIADSRFQEGLAAEGRRAGKLPQDWQVPEDWKINTPGRVAEWLSQAKTPFRTFPFGTDFTDVEQSLLPVLERLREYNGDRMWMARAILGGGGRKSAPESAALERMGLAAPKGIKEHILARLLIGAMRMGDSDGR